MKQELIRTVSDFFAEILTWVPDAAGGLVLLVALVIIGGGVIIAMFLRADPEARRDFIDLVHGYDKSIR